MVFCCDRHGGGYLSLRTALGIASGREKGALIEAGGTFEDRAIERKHLAGSMSVRQEKLVLCVLRVEWQETETGRSRERHFGPNETGA